MEWHHLIQLKRRWCEKKEAEPNNGGSALASNMEEEEQAAMEERRAHWMFQNVKALVR